MIHSPKITEGAGKAGCRLHPQPRVQSVVAHECSRHRFAGTPGLPCAMVLTVSFALSPEIGLSCLRRPADQSIVRTRSGRHASTGIDAGVEASGPHDFTVRDSAVRQRAVDRSRAKARPAITCVPDAAASTASLPASVTIAIRPSGGWDGGGYRSDLGKARNGFFLRAGLDRANRIDPVR
jgi:hypothetical protein